MKPVTSSLFCHRRMIGAGGKRKDKNISNRPHCTSPVTGWFSAGPGPAEQHRQVNYLLSESWVRGERSLEVGWGGWHGVLMWGDPSILLLSGGEVLISSWFMTEEWGHNGKVYLCLCVCMVNQLWKDGEKGTTRFNILPTDLVSDWQFPLNRENSMYPILHSRVKSDS